jgi:hypothetical protein
MKKRKMSKKKGEKKHKSGGGEKAFCSVIRLEN